MSLVKENYRQRGSNQEQYGDGWDRIFGKKDLAREPGTSPGQSENLPSVTISNREKAVNVIADCIYQCGIDPEQADERACNLVDRLEKMNLVSWK